MAEQDRGGPIAGPEFDRAMAALGPFENEPYIALGFSGGRDSLALAWLLGEWAKARNGAVAALILDHGLRPDSASEAAAAEALIARIRARGFPVRAHRLQWKAAKPGSRIQEKAREARYRLLADWCRQEHVLHLAIAHHAEDQAETLALRRERGSGPLGLAGMSALRPLGGVRLLRPLLGFPRDRLTASLQERGETWIEDPSNFSPRFARPRLRAIGLDSRALEAEAATYGLARQDWEEKIALWHLSHTRLDPAGHAWLNLSDEGAAGNPGQAGAEEAEIASLAIGDLIRTIGAGLYAPSPARLRDWVARLRAGSSGQSLGGALIRLGAGRHRGQWLICREARSIADIRVAPGSRGDWDGRFAFEIAGDIAVRGPLSLGPLGEAGLIALAALGKLDRAGREAIPPAARPALPSLRAGGDLIAIPHLGFGSGLFCRFRPRHPLTGSGFALAKTPARTR